MEISIQAGIKNKLNIRYVKLHFVLEIVENCRLPKHKSSAIRGGIGEMLLRANCIRNRECETCDFTEECIVQRTMYSKYEIQPTFVTSGDSIGYVLECEDYRELFNKGDELRFNLILFGKTICYFSQYMNSVYALGQNGLGKEHSRFAIKAVLNTYNEPIMTGNNMLMERYKIATLEDYVSYRKSQLENNPTKIVFITPTSIKYQNEQLKSFNMTAVTTALQRRIYMLNCFEGVDASDFYNEELDSPEINFQSCKEHWIERYSSRRDSRMRLHGINGEVELMQPLEKDLLDLYLAGEIIHVGKNTSFGFGRLVLK